jgi:hypothetical protein
MSRQQCYDCAASVSSCTEGLNALCTEGLNALYGLGTVYGVLFVKSTSVVVFIGIRIALQYYSSLSSAECSLY